MTLKCECGGSVTLQDTRESGDETREYYRCVACGRTGDVRFGDNGVDHRGCVTAEVMPNRVL